MLLAPSGLLNVLGQQLPTLLIAYLYGSAVAGWLGLTQRVLALPVMLVGAAVAQVYLAELARAVRSDPQRALLLFRRASRTLVVVAIVVAGGLLALSTWAFPIVFGPAWQNSGRYAQALAVALATQLVAVPLSLTLVVLERQTLQLVWDFGRLAVTTGIVAVTAYTGHSAIVAIWGYGIASALFYTLSWWLGAQALQRHHRSSVRLDQLIAEEPPHEHSTTG